jgi:hypothetical protein
LPAPTAAGSTCDTPSPSRSRICGREEKRGWGVGVGVGRGSARGERQPHAAAHDARLRFARSHSAHKKHTCPAPPPQTAQRRPVCGVCVVRLFPRDPGTRRGPRLRRVRAHPAPSCGTHGRERGYAGRGAALGGSGAAKVGWSVGRAPHLAVVRLFAPLLMWRTPPFSRERGARALEERLANKSTKAAVSDVEAGPSSA